MKRTTEYFSGRVQKIVWFNEDFYIFRMIMDATSDSYDPSAESGMFFGDANQVTVKGNIPGYEIKEGSWVGIEGMWTNHEQHGKQVQIVRAPVIREWTKEVSLSILAANGVGPRICSAIADKFGEGLVDVLNAEDAVEQIGQAKGLTPLVAEHVVATWISIRAYYNTLQFLNQLGIHKSKISQIWSYFGDDAEKVLTKNPWRLVEIEGITFPQADEVARKLKLDLSQPARMEGAVHFAARTGRGMGHVYMTLNEVLAKVGAFIHDATSQQVAKALASCHKSGTLILDRKTREGVTAVYEPWLYNMEQQAAEMLDERMEIAALDPEEDVTKEYMKALASIGDRAYDKLAAGASIKEIARAALDDWTSSSKIQLSEDQMNGALNALTEPVSILTGLPGTGKTTTLRSVVSVLQNAEVNFLLIAPTGIAAKRLKAVTGAPAHTIHRAFGAKGAASDDDREHKYSGIVGQRSSEDRRDASVEVWDCSQTPHPADVVICDESSMVDQHLMYRILSCTKPTARIVLVGDAAQLPSVGPGNVLRELISSALFPMVNLTEIYRQAETSQIVIAAHAMHAGEIPETGTSKDDFVLVSENSEDRILAIICKLASKLYDKQRNFQIISPKHGGTLGVTNLNARVRELLNPRMAGLAEFRIGDEVLREGDRIMVVKNDYELNIFNGDVGKVRRLDKAARQVEIKVHGPPDQMVRLPFNKASKRLRLAYAMTVHKCQGMEYDTIVMPLVKSFSHQLQRNLLYTAITRAKTKVLLVGHHGALVKAVLNNREEARNTLFGDRLQVVFADDSEARLEEAIASVVEPKKNNVIEFDFRKD